MSRFAAALLVALGACAQAPVTPGDSVVPGTIGVTVRQQETSVVVAAVAKTTAAAGLRVGDVVLRYNGEAVTDPRQFYRLMLDTPPGSLARLEVLREGTRHTLELPVGELDLFPRV